MRIEVLEYFLEIAECRSFSQASSNLFISQQGLSKAMRALESELGVVPVSYTHLDVYKRQLLEDHQRYVRAIAVAESLRTVQRLSLIHI